MTTWNTSYSLSGNVTFSNHNQTASFATTGSIDTPVLGTTFKSAGKWVFRCQLTTVSFANMSVGLAASGLPNNHYLGQDSLAVSINSNGYFISAGSVGTGPNFTNSGLFADVAIDFGNKLIYTRTTDDALWNHSNANIALASGIPVSGLSSFLLTPAINLNQPGDVGVYFTAAPFVSGYSSWDMLSDVQGIIDAKLTVKSDF